MRVISVVVMPGVRYQAVQKMSVSMVATMMMMVQDWHKFCAQRNNIQLGVFDLWRDS